MYQTGDGGLEVKGVVLDKKIGLYAARIASISKLNKDIKTAGPQYINYQKTEGDFTVTVPGPINDAFYCHEDPKIIQFYYRDAQIDKIQYGVESNERINFGHLKLALSLSIV